MMFNTPDQANSGKDELADLGIYSTKACHLLRIVTTK
jgi:hypothetical protein